jgi:hypothetical protein
MTFIEPMPQEIALAHVGRIEFLFPSELSILESKARSANEPKLVTLAKACGMTSEQYARNHSLMPFFRMVAGGAQPAAHGQLGQETLTRRVILESTAYTAVKSFGAEARWQYSMCANKLAQ